MKEFYSNRLKWIFNYTKRNFFYVLCKTLCLVVGVPLYAVLFVVEMVLTFIYAVLSFVPILSVVATIVCKSLTWVCSLGYYLCVLPDIKEVVAEEKASAAKSDVEQTETSDSDAEEQSQKSSDGDE